MVTMADFYTLNCTLLLLSSSFISLSLSASCALFSDSDIEEPPAVQCAISSDSTQQDAPTPSSMYGGGQVDTVCVGTCDGAGSLLVENFQQLLVTENPQGLNVCGFAVWEPSERVQLANILSKVLHSC